MSQLEVDKIIPQSGTTLTIGDSGDTISFAEGTNLGIDTNTLVIDSTNNRVGIKNASPTVELDVTGATKISGDLTVDTNTLYVDSTNNNVGIGTTSTVEDAGYTSLTISGSTGSQIVLQDDGVSEGVIWNNNALNVESYSTYHIAFRTGGSEAMRIDSSGNIGIGTTPSSWGGTFKAIDIKSYASFSADSDTAFMTANGYYNGTNWIYKNTNGATRYFQQAGNHIWSKASSGTAGNTITWSEAMRITSGGNVGIGTSSPTELLTISTKGGLQDDPDALSLGSSYSNTAGSPSRLKVKVYDAGGDNANGLGHSASLMNIVSGLSGHSMAFYTNGGAGSTERMRIDSSGSVVIGSGGLDVSGLGGTYTALNMRAGSGYATIYGQTTATTTNSGAISIVGATSGASAGGSAEMLGVIQIVCESDSSTNAVGSLRFYTGSGGAVSEKMRITSGGSVFIGTTDDSVYNNSGSAQGGINFGIVSTGSGNIQVARDSENPLFVNRLVNDGNLVDLRQDGTQEGTISVSGATVSYNGFTGTHWSRLTDNSKPTILKGTILESLDEMMDWYQVQFDVIKTDDEGNESTITKKESYGLGDGESVGDVITYNFEGTDYQATIIQEGDVKHTKSKISDTVDAKNVYGVFMDWDNDATDNVNDLLVAQTGTFVVRMNSAEIVSKGDLIQSNGDGTGKVQADDIIRSSTVAKILSTTKIETYEDGSYIVPCSLHC